MDIDASESRHIQYGFRKNTSVGNDHDQIRIHPPYNRLRFLVIQGFRLKNRNMILKSVSFDRRKRNPLSSSVDPVRLCKEGQKLVALPCNHFQ